MARVVGSRAEFGTLGTLRGGPPTRAAGPSASAALEAWAGPGTAVPLEAAAPQAGCRFVGLRCSNRARARGTPRGLRRPGRRRRAGRSPARASRFHTHVSPLGSHWPPRTRSPTPLPRAPPEQLRPSRAQQLEPPPRPGAPAAPAPAAPRGLHTNRIRDERFLHDSSRFSLKSSRCFRDARAVACRCVRIFRLSTCS